MLRILCVIVVFFGFKFGLGLLLSTTTAWWTTEVVTMTIGIMALLVSKKHPRHVAFLCIAAAVTFLPYLTLVHTGAQVAIGNSITFVLGFGSMVAYLAHSGREPMMPR